MRRHTLILLASVGISILSATRLEAGGTGTSALPTPQGSGTTTANGEYIAASTGIDVPFRYFIEVPPGTPELLVDLFDADVGAGGGAEAGANRDRARGAFDTAVTYRLLDPSGTTVSTLSLAAGQNATFDNLWTSAFGSRNFRDDFTASSFANDDGSLTWAGGWIEVDGAGAGPAAGNALIQGGLLRLDDNPDTGGQPSLARQADLSPFQAAVVLFDFATTAGVDATDSVVFEWSGNGGATYTTAETFTGIAGATASSRAFNVPAALLTSSFRLRFRVAANYGGGNEEFQVDNLEIRVDGRVGPAAGHWQLQVDLSSAVTVGDDINAHGLRAHDGAPGSGGTELDVYYLSQSAFGTNPGLSRLYPLHPYVTSGCTLDSNDFDMDANGSTTHTGRTGAFTQTLPVSGNDVWLQGVVSGWTTDQVSGDYGIWDTDFTVTTTAGAGNYGHLYLGSFQAAPPPPTANPEADTFRIYLPTDAGSAPAKPYLEQLLTFVAGPNPPIAGQTTRLSVTVRLVNPGARAIAFSAPAEVVTANVPGGGVTYAGAVQVSQGTVTAQPAVGGTGDVLWNPGTVAAGQTVLLAYQVEVTPAAAVFDLPVTGTPASNGTRSRFVDGTGVSTFLFGPICELRVRSDALTHATVAGFRVVDDGGVPAIEWETVSEAGTAGYRVLRRERPGEPWTPVHQGLLGALPGAPQGAGYRLVPETGSGGEDAEYLLVEVETSGRERVHGPFSAHGAAADPSFGLRRLSVGPDPAFSVTPRKVPRETGPAERPGAAVAPLSRARRFGPEALVEVTENGLYRLSAEQIAAALGRPAGWVERQIRSRQLELSLQGEPVAWTPLGRDRGLLFYGQSIDALFPEGQPFTGRNVYRLRPGSGERMIEVHGRRPRSVEPGEGFREVLRIERDLTPVTALPLDPDGDFWFWAAINASRAAQASAVFDLAVPEPSPAGTEAELTVRFQGAAETSHPVEVEADGVPLGETVWSGIAPHRAVFALPHELLDDGLVQVRVTGVQPAGPANQLFVDGFELRYLRRFRADGAAVEVEAEGAREIAVTGFAGGDVRVFDLGEPRRPRIVDRTEVELDPQGDGFRVSFDASHPRLDPDGRYLLVTPAGYREVAAIRPAGGADLRSPGNRAEVLVIAPDALLDAAGELASLRMAQGLSAAVVALDDVHDVFGGGLTDPRAVRDFLRFAAERWQVPPRWVVLVGAGTIDPRDLLGLGGTPAGVNLFTPLLVSTPQGLFASDARFADFDGDGVPETAIGRLPVTDAGQLRAYVGRVAAYEAGGAQPWAERALLAADDADLGGDFSADVDRLARLLPQGVLTEIALGAVPLAAARQQLQLVLNEGVSVFGYVGHSGLDRMAGEGLLTAADVPGLFLADRPPVVFALTCTLARFELPFPSLGGELLRSPQGAVAVWAPSGLSDSRDAAVLGDRFLRELFHPGTVTLGEATRNALAEVQAVGGSESMVGVYNLLGDPALLIPRPPVAPGEGTAEE